MAKRGDSKITGYIQSIYKVVRDTTLVRCDSEVSLMRLLWLYKRVYGLINGLLKKSSHYLKQRL